MFTPLCTLWSVSPAQLLILVNLIQGVLSVNKLKLTQNLSELIAYSVCSYNYCI